MDFVVTLVRRWQSFSALQRAENSSIQRRGEAPVRIAAVSVLFSEPKIPQFALARNVRPVVDGFSALQRAENSSMGMCDPISNS